MHTVTMRYVFVAGVVEEEDTVWWHYLTIAIPAQIKYDDAFLLQIGGGNKGSG